MFLHFKCIDCAGKSVGNRLGEPRAIAIRARAIGRSIEGGSGGGVQPKRWGTTGVHPLNADREVRSVRVHAVPSGAGVCPGREGGIPSPRSVRQAHGLGRGQTVRTLAKLQLRGGARSRRP